MDDDYFEQSFDSDISNFYEIPMYIHNQFNDDEENQLDYLQIQQNFENEMDVPEPEPAVVINEEQETIELSRIQNIEKVQSFVEEIQCPICYNILIAPQYCKKCEKSFCQVCYDAWIQNSNYGKCPCCRQKLSATSSAPKLLINLLNKLKLFCQNKDQGCTQILDYELRIKHNKNECLYTLVPCQNLGCSIKIQRKDVNTHKGKCPYEMIVCELCADTIQRSQTEYHLINDCSFRIVTCQWCTSTMEFCYYQSHEPNCPCKYEICQYCKTKYTKDKFQNHTKVKCYKKQKNYYKHKYEQQQKKNSNLEKQITNQNELILILQRQINDMNLNKGQSRVRILCNFCSYSSY